MTASGPRYPVTVSSSSVAPYDDSDWTTPEYIGADDTNYANITPSSFDTDDYSYRIAATNFGFEIPAGATIDGVSAEVARYYADGAVIDALIQLTKDGTNGAGDNQSAGATWDTAMGTATFGGATELWNTTWTAEEINAETFGVLFACRASANNADAFVDYIRITINYTETLGTATASLAVTLQAATLTAEVDTTATASLAQTLAAATLSSEVDTTATGALAVTLANATLTASGTGVTEATATLNVTLANATLSAETDTTASASLSQTLAGATLSSEVDTPASASLTATLANATLSADVECQSNASLSVTLANASLSSEVDTIATASLVQTLASATLLSSGAVTSDAITAALIVTLASATLSTSGASVFPDNRKRGNKARYPVFVGRNAIIYKTRR